MAVAKDLKLLPKRPGIKLSEANCSDASTGLATVELSGKIHSSNKRVNKIYLNSFPTK